MKINKLNNDTIKNNINTYRYLMIIFFVMNFISIFYCIFNYDNSRLLIIGGFVYFMSLAYMFVYAVSIDILINRLEIRESKMELWLKFHKDIKINNKK